MDNNLLCYFLLFAVASSCAATFVVVTRPLRRPVIDPCDCTGCIVTRYTSGYQPCEHQPTTGAPGDE